ncbi:glycine cleavage T-protein [Trypanosoma conorhini]|uniref:Aminomethyltransferase n=1 Tax=Trypanosoma conorhini TaxID=83891 RepID=A0A3R7NYB8_9TRYP|nr:glycine cleavage T-protein [Trypanosoma conorhini]RNF13886.1 glycine cleavage T-protein [Trypanosoma conorhini]
MSAPLRHTALHGFHVSHKARMVPFAGYHMPIHYSRGLLHEHLHTRRAAGLFDVSHMGSFEVWGADRYKFFQWLTPSAVAELSDGQSVLTLFLNEAAGVKDDCIVSRYADRLLVVVNAGCKAKIMSHVRERLAEFKGDAAVVELDRAMVSLQGPAAAAVLGPHLEDLEKLHFMHGRRGVDVQGIDLTLTRCSYSGEDGFDISVPHEHAVRFAELLLQNSATELAGLGARDSLRVEAGLCLYSHELAEEISPVAARLMWSIPKSRLAEGGFIGHARLKTLLRRAKELVPRLRMGIVSLEKGPVARAGAPILVDGAVVGEVTSGVPSPTLTRNIAMGYIDRAQARVGQHVELDVRGRRVPGEVTLPRFVPLRYYKG